MEQNEIDEPRGRFLCGEFYVYRSSSGWAVLNDHDEPPDVYGLKSCAHALQWIYDYRMERLRNGYIENKA